MTRKKKVPISLELLLFYSLDIQELLLFSLISKYTSIWSFFFSFSFPSMLYHITFSGSEGRARSKVVICNLVLWLVFNFCIQEVWQKYLTAESSHPKREGRRYKRTNYL